MTAEVGASGTLNEAYSEISLVAYQYISHASISINGITDVEMCDTRVDIQLNTSVASMQTSS